MSGWEDPSVGVVGEAEVDESAEVQHCSSGRQGDAVAVGTSVADTAVSVGDEPRNGSFDHGPILPVVVEVVSLAPLGACLGEELVVVADREDPAPGGGGASRPLFTAVAVSPEVGSPSVVDRSRDLVGAGNGPCPIVDREVISGVLVVAETPVTSQRYRFDHDGVVGVSEVGTHRTRPVSGIAENLETRDFVFEEFDTNGSVTDIGRGQGTGGNNPRFGFDRNMGFVSVPIRRSGLVHVPCFRIHR